MKKLLTLLISCSLTLAATAMAQQEEEQPTKPQNEEKTSPKPKAAHKEHAGMKAQERMKGQEGMRAQENAAPQESAAPKQEPAARNESAPNQPGRKKAHATEPSGANANANVNAEANADMQAKAKEERMKRGGEQTKKEQAAQNQPANKAAAPTPVPAASAAMPPATGTQTAKPTAQAKKPDPQKVQAIKTQHASFRAQAKPEKVASVTFNQSYRIEGAERWQGPQYVAFRDYRPIMHDQGWYRSHYTRVELIGGGYYYWNAGYWYPAWGYDTSAAYYPYDGPIYVGSRAQPPDQVIADVQAVLQEMGYYRGEVDGLLGPLTREALTAYQSDNGLYTTAAIDQPTLDALGMS